MWTLNQGDGSISRVDVATNKVVATIQAGLSGRGGEIAVGEGSVWVTLFEFPITRIDPSTNKVAQQFFESDWARSGSPISSKATCGASIPGESRRLFHSERSGSDQTKGSPFT